MNVGEQRFLKPHSDIRLLLIKAIADHSIFKYALFFDYGKVFSLMSHIVNSVLFIGFD